MRQTLLPKRLALPIFASDTLSSVAYATEAMLVVLLAASASAHDLVMPISLGVAALLWIVVFSYRQTVRAYTSNGGAYVVASDNFGPFAGLVAAAALLIDYVLTVAVSIAAGVLALSSAETSLHPYLLELALGFLLLVAIVNLRGVREAGVVFAIPTYSFIVAVLAMIATGLVKCAASGCPQAAVEDPIALGPAGALGVFVVLRAFASGSSALTGVEAIANGVSAFRPPQAENAARTLLLMGVIASSLFLGVSYLAWQTDAVPSHTVSVVSEIARGVFPKGSPEGVLFYFVQFSTLAILVLAANTAFQGFPRLAALLARDRFAPAQFADLGDRLVYSNGLLVLTVAAALLLVAFGAGVNRLLNLYLVGVFTAFTLCQAGMVRHWLRLRREDRARARGWGRSVAINALGALATGIVTILVIGTKFTQGAWTVVVVAAFLIAAMYAVRREYEVVERRVRKRRIDMALVPETPFVLYVERLDAATAEALDYVVALRGDEFRAIHVQTGSTPPDLQSRWREFSGSRAELELLPAAESPVSAVIDYLESVPVGEHDLLSVVIPELFEDRSVLAAVRQGTEFGLRVQLFGQPRIVVADVPVLAPAGAAEVRGPSRAATVTALVLVSSVNDATALAVNYARAIRPHDVQALFFALNPEHVDTVRREWVEWGMPVPLQVVDTPFRELEGPLLDSVRRVTSSPGSLAGVIVPELAAPGWWRDLLHNGRSLQVKRILQFEPEVVVSSVPYPLGSDPPLGRFRREAAR
jgi:amino acid transporter